MKQRHVAAALLTCSPWAVHIAAWVVCRGSLLRNPTPLALTDAQSGEPTVRCDACCVEDFCHCGTCDCWRVLKSLGYQLPLNAAAAYKQGEVLTSDILQWRSGDFPSWHPVDESQLQIRPSKIAGLGLFAAGALDAKVLLPPYQGLSLLNADLSNLGYTNDEDNYVWCPRDRNDTSAMDPSFCVDGRSMASRDNPARFVNGARSLEQCQEVNLEICELGQVGYFRTLKAIPAETELLVDYGPSYWSDFAGC